LVHPKESFVELLRRELKEFAELRKMAEADAIQANTRLSILDKRIAMNEEAIRQIEGQPILEVKSREYASMSPINAIIHYLTQRGGGPVAIRQELLPALVQRGGQTNDGGELADLTEPERYRIIKIVITANVKNGKIELDEKADTVRLPKSRK
jgi:hypothetical protein